MFDNCILSGVYYRQSEGKRWTSMKNRHIYMAMSLLLAAVLVLTGCGAGKDPASEGPEQSTSGEDTPPVSQSVAESAPEPEPEPASSEAESAPSASETEAPSEQASSESASASETEVSETIAAPEMSESGDAKTFTFSELPQNAAQMESVLDRTDPKYVAALFMTALVRYIDSPEDGTAMIDVLCGPRPMSEYDKSFMEDRFRDKKYLPKAYFEGANPKNDYTPEEPLTLIIYGDSVVPEEGYAYVNVKTTGADSQRRIVLRIKDGNYYIWNYSNILVGIRLPASEDPWI